MDVLKDQDRAAAAADVFLDRDKATVEAVWQIDETDKKPKGSIFKSYRESFVLHFSKWPHLKVLLGCALTWFFLDIGYYGTSLNTATALGYIGFGKPTGNYTNPNAKIYDDVWNRSVGTALINLAGTVPGYWFTVAFIEKWGRKPIQFMGFTMLTLIFLFLTIFFPQLTDLKTSNFIGFMVLYALAQFFFQFWSQYNNLCHSSRSIPYKCAIYCSWYISCIWKGRSNHCSTRILFCC
jgi:PHS family inorganic phosphate transporter-like MFS transporter